MLRKLKIVKKMEKWIKMLILEIFVYYGEFGIVKKGKLGCVLGWEIGMC